MSTAADRVGPREFWEPIEQRLGAAPPEGILWHRLGALAANQLRHAGRAVPEAMHEEERWVAVAMLAIGPLLERIRGATDEPLVLMKGPELAIRYPANARTFWDLDILTRDARAVHRSLKDEGFVEVGDPALYHRIHHLRPLQLPAFPLAVEIHSEPKWPKHLPTPVTDEIIEHAIASVTGPPGILAPRADHHVLLVAGHGWAHEPLQRLRDLLDVAVLARELDPAEVRRRASAWRSERLWATTETAVAAFVDGRPLPLSLRLWCRHLRGCRERTVLESHLQKWFAPYYSLAPRAATAASFRAVRDDLRAAPDESPRDKLSRSAKALWYAARPLSRHREELGDAANRGRVFNPPEDS